MQLRLKEIRKTGISTAHGEVTPNVYGIAAPIFDVGDVPIAALSVTIDDKFIKKNDLEAIKIQVKDAAHKISFNLAQQRIDGIS